MQLEFGSVVLVPFPFSNQAESKRRPAVVVSSRDYNRSRLDVVVMAVTSQMRPVASLGEVWVASWHAAGLLKPSVVKPVFATVEQRLLMRHLGQLTEPDRVALAGAIAEILR